jgi:signal transduction histidine kinase
MVRRRTKNDPEHFAGEILEFGAATIANLILRLNYFVDYRLQSHAENFYKVPGAGLPQDLTDTILPQLMTMHRALGELLLMRASIARQTELARAKRIENQRLEKFLAGATDSVRQPVNGSVGAARKPIGKKQVAEPDPESLFQWNESLDTKMRKDVRRILRGPTGNPCAKYGPPVEL